MSQTNPSIKFSVFNNSGFIDENENIEDRKSKVNALAKDIISTIKV